MSDPGILLQIILRINLRGYSSVDIYAIRELRNQLMELKPQDVLVALKLAAGGAWTGTYAALAGQVGISASEVHAAVRRLAEARLVNADDKQVRRQSLRNFLVHGLPHVFPAKPKEVTRGFPTAWAAPGFSGSGTSQDRLPPVWPDPEGDTQGVAVKPLYRSAALAARRDSKLYQLLAAVDSLRLGRARERKMAEDCIDHILLSE